MLLPGRKGKEHAVLRYEGSLGVERLCSRGWGVPRKGRTIGGEAGQVDRGPVCAGVRILTLRSRNIIWARRCL